MTLRRAPLRHQPNTYTAAQVALGTVVVEDDGTEWVSAFDAYGQRAWVCDRWFPEQAIHGSLRIPVSDSPLMDRIAAEDARFDDPATDGALDARMEAEP